MHANHELTVFIPASLFIAHQPPTLLVIKPFSVYGNAYYVICIQYRCDEQYIIGVFDDDIGCNGLC